MNGARDRGAAYLHDHTDGTPAGRPLAFAHRGFAPDGDENTMAAFRAAVGLGYRYLETDVRTTRDGVLVVFHDERLDRATDGIGRVADHTYAELRRLRVAGRGRIPTFAELLGEWPDIRLNVDVKDQAGAALLARHIEAADAYDRVLVSSFSARRLASARRALARPAALGASVPTVALAALLGPVGLLGGIGPLLRAVDALQVPVRKGPIPVATAGFVRRAHRRGLHVHVWVVNDPDRMRRLLDLGVDGVMTDRADLLAEAMAERGHWPQRPPR
ncbi:glycerophosphoryl diester phosphodiesterase [Zafaria cholistanensis]|uniref:Glycerophosphoryl diester phosphodiesterase n=1 Tax=Zafaria cholistanensis TaxID=1682741 RepID=A0A5A7NS25_9MICC|nr:glycerophosphodiester phosphodiesterase family protein [Zafaria cholistanensis]GER22912.1 glycerophosphoryl diester phosphodiesterase [Zafaria cholistanensis]